MITEILAYFTVGIITIGWVLTVIFDLVRKIQNNSQKEEISEASDKND